MLFLKPGVRIIGMHPEILFRAVCRLRVHSENALAGNCAGTTHSATILLHAPG